ncbi:uncharacterized protein LOC122544179 isoform X2 [Chiloscyllium plagiosum]|uniref:uncharacterized protein LOC122544179 isoform X2 n=1 Tax=Chiloscyllium plagiosum TaxID=36176 RepID=UPI001CB848F8|nr:uncharacterized protein LOC122544179 isoform X2 [Chiloscyllium plagiosum]
MERARLTAITVWSLLSLVDSEALTISVSERRINAAIRDPVLLSVRPSERVRSGSWKHNGSDVLLWINTTADINNVYTGRVEFLQSNSSLLLKSVTASDNGEYCVTMNAFVDAVANTTIILSVFEPISSVSIISNVSNTVKENDTVSLRCHVLGDWTEIVWLFNGSLVNSKGKTIFSSGNAMLTIIHVDTSNTGNYRCIARSPVSEKASEPYSLSLDNHTSSKDSKGYSGWSIWLLAILAPCLMICCVVFTRNRISCCDQQCSCSFLSRYLFYFWVSCCNRKASDNITDSGESGNLAGTWMACCSARLKKECDSPCIEEPRTLSGLSLSCCSSVIGEKNEFQDETKTEIYRGILLSCCSGRSPNGTKRTRHCCGTWMSCCKTRLKDGIETSTFRGLWLSCCDRGFEKDEQSQEYNETRELCDCWVACCNKGQEESRDVYVNPITCTTGQQQARHFRWTSTGSDAAMEQPGQSKTCEKNPGTKSPSKAFPIYAAVKKKRRGNETVNLGKGPPASKVTTRQSLHTWDHPSELSEVAQCSAGKGLSELPCHYVDLQHPDTGSKSSDVIPTKHAPQYTSLKF